MKRPSIKSPCVADRHHNPGERIAEVSFPGGEGCLIRLYTAPNGACIVEVYRKDPKVQVWG